MNGTDIILSAAATAGSVVAGAAGDTVMQYVMLALNILVLISNCFLSIYRKWRDRDRDIIDDKTDEPTDKKNDDNGGE